MSPPPPFDHYLPLRRRVRGIPPLLPPPTKFGNCASSGPASAAVAWSGCPDGPPRERKKDKWCVMLPRIRIAEETFAHPTLGTDYHDGDSLLFGEQQGVC